MDEDEKRCSKCEAWKPRTWEYFAKDKRTRDGFHSHCKVCQARASRSWQRRNRDKVRATKRAYRTSERGRTLNLENRNKHRPARNLRQRKRYRNDPSYRQKCLMQSQSTHRKRWHATPDAAKLHNASIRARKYGCEGEWTSQEWRTLCNRYNNCCLACGSDDPLTVDHIVPLEKGGRNDIGNIQPLCMKCNQHKGLKIIDYRTLYGQVSQLVLFGDSETREQ